MNLPLKELTFESFSSAPTSPRTGPSLSSWLSGQEGLSLVEHHLDDFPIEIWNDVLLGSARQFLDVPGKSLRRTFVRLGWDLAQHLHSDTYAKTAQKCPEELIALIELLHAGSLIIDDIEDQSDLRRGRPSLHLQIGLAPALNLGNWLYFVAGSMIDRLQCQPQAKLILYQTLNRTLLRCHQGQALDVGCRVDSLSRSDVSSIVNRSTQLKSGALIGYALQLGSLYLGVPLSQTRPLYQFGQEIGQILQMYDDLSGFLNPARWEKGQEDLINARLTWIWVWLAQNPHLSDEAYLDLTQELSWLEHLENQNESVHLQTHLDLIKKKSLPYLPQSGLKMTQLIDQAGEKLHHELQNVLESTLNPTFLKHTLQHAFVKLKTSYL